MAHIRAGVLGIGFMGAAHVEALRRIPGVEVVAVADVNRAKARQVAGSLDIPKVLDSPEDLINDPSVDVVHNCTPNVNHLELTRSAIHAGKHVVSEKPLGMNSRETRELVETAQRAGVVAAVNFVYRYFPLTQQARSLLQSGRLGNVLLVHGCYLQDWLLYRHDYNWRIERSRGGASRAVADIGSHWCDLIQHISGARITDVCADAAPVHTTRLRPASEVDTFSSAGQSETIETRVETEDYAGVLLELTGAVRGSFVVSQVSAGHKNGLVCECNCAKASIRWAQEEPNSLWIGYRDRENGILTKDPSLLDEAVRRYASYPGGHGEGYPDGIKNLLSNVYKRIENRNTPVEYPTFLEAHRITLLVEAIMRSSAERRWISVPTD